MSTTETPAQGDHMQLPRLEIGEVPDIQTQLEDILGSVWVAEANWRLDDRLDLAVRAQQTVRKPKKRKR